MDYAYQVWLGRLPEFYEGTIFKAPRGSNIPVQWVSQHPPLFYLILAPIVGPLIEADRFLLAGLAARAINILIGGCVVLVAARAGRLIGGTPVHARISAILTSCSAWLYGVSAAIYNDALAALTGGLVFTCAASIFQEGPARRRHILLTVACAAAMLTRITLLAVVGPTLLFLFIESFVHSDSRRIGQAIGVVFAGAVTMASSGWFYARNLQLSGSITGGHPEWAADHLDRTAVPFLSLVSSLDFWRRAASVFDPDVSSGSSFETLIVVLPLLLVIVFIAIPTSGGSDCRKSNSRLWSVGLAACVMGSSILLQILFAMGGGAVNPRYLLPALVPLAVYMAGGLVALHHSLIGVWFVAWTLMFIPWWIGLPRVVDALKSMPIFPTASDILVSIGLFVIGTAVVAASLGRVRKEPCANAEKRSSW